MAIPGAGTISNLLKTLSGVSGKLANPATKGVRKSGLLDTLNGPMVGLASVVAPGLAMPAAEGIGEFVSGRGHRQLIKSVLSSRSPLADQRRFERLQKIMAYNESRLALNHPHMYTELLVGRRLPKGARVYGATPSRELLEETTFRMSTGTLPTGE